MLTNKAIWNKANSLMGNNLLWHSKFSAGSLIVPPCPNLYKDFVEFLEAPYRFGSGTNAEHHWFTACPGRAQTLWGLHTMFPSNQTPRFRFYENSWYRNFQFAHSDKIYPGLLIHTKNCIPGSPGISISEQEDLLSEDYYRLPNPAEISFTAFMQFMLRSDLSYEHVWGNTQITPEIFLPSGHRLIVGVGDLGVEGILTVNATVEGGCLGTPIFGVVV